jgi:hypothetical protein
MLRNKYNINNFLKMYKTFIPVCSYIGFLYGVCDPYYYTLSDKYKSIVFYTVGGTLVGIGWPLIIPFYIYNKYQKDYYVSIKKDELYPIKYKNRKIE